MSLCDLSGPEPPSAPDYAGAAREQGAANIEAAKQQGKINNPNVINPYGTQTVTWGDLDTDAYNRALSDYAKNLNQYNSGPRTGPAPIAPTAEQYTSGDGDTPTLTQKFSPEQQAIFDSSNKTKLQLNNLAGQGAEAAGQIVGKNLDLSQLPGAPKSGQVNQQVIDAMMGRVNEDYGRAKGEANSSLIAAGIRPGTQAYDDRMQLLQRGKNDAAQQAVTAGYAQGQNQFNQQTQERKDALAEYLTQRQVPLNEITALMSGSQVNNQFATPGYAQNTQVGAAPVFGATQQKAAWDQGLYNVGAAQAGNTVSGLFGLGGAILGGGS